MAYKLDPMTVRPQVNKACPKAAEPVLFQERPARHVVCVVNVMDDIRPTSASTFASDGSDSIFRRETFHGVDARVAVVTAHRLFLAKLCAISCKAQYIFAPGAGIASLSDSLTNKFHPVDACVGLLVFLAWKFWHVLIVPAAYRLMVTRCINHVVSPGGNPVFLIWFFVETTAMASAG